MPFLWTCLCVHMKHFNNLRCTISEILAKIVETGGIVHKNAVPNLFTRISETVYLGHQNVLLADIIPP